MPGITLNAERRSAIGSAAVGRLRHTGKLPAVVYGNGTESISVELDHHDVTVSFPTRESREAAFHIVLDGETIEVKIQAIQRHKTRNTALHLDLQRV